MCVATVTAFALVTVSEHSVACLVPRARLMHRLRDGGAVSWPGGYPCENKTAASCSCWKVSTTLNGAAPRKYSAYRTETVSSEEELADDTSLPLNRPVRIVKLVTNMN